MKKALLTSALALALTIPAISYAQTTDSPAGHNMQQQGKGQHGMMKELNLTPQQKQQMRAIMEKQHAETQRQIRAILTPEQQKIFDQNQAKRQAMKQQHMQKRQQNAPAQ